MTSKQIEQMVERYLTEEGENCFPTFKVSSAWLQGDNIYIVEEGEDNTHTHCVCILEFLTWMYSRGDK